MNYVTDPLFDLGWWFTNQCLSATSSVMQLVNPHMPEWVLWFTSKGLLKFSDLINQQWLLDPMLSISTTHVVIPAVGQKYGQNEEQDTEVFFRLGVDHYKCNYGSGDLNDPENCFFPDSLAEGPILVDQGTSPMTNRRNVEIASSCALLSLLSYRHDDTIIDCMRGSNPLMLPHVWFLSAHTVEESDLAVFVADDQSWAVFCFRGTEPETLRDWCTSALLSKLVSFSTGSTQPDHSELMRVVKVRGRYDRQLKAVYNEKLMFCGGDFNPIPPNHEVTPYEFALYLHQRGCNVYYTGHSLGGGLATLMAAKMFALSGQSAAGIVSFGSPPVGNKAFCDWFNEHFVSQHPNKGQQRHAAVSWRFVNGDEFAPMAPPLPFTSPQLCGEFRHVGDLILVEHLMEPPDQEERERTQSDMASRMNDLSRQHNLVKIFLDHNLASTIRALREAMANEDE